MPAKHMTGWPRVIALGVAACAIGMIGSSSLSKSPSLTLRTTTITHQAAYTLPKIPHGTSFRMAMLHDVLLERYLRHGEAWYQQRNQQARAIMQEEHAKPGPPSLRLLDAMDDLAVGLENVHQSDAAAQVMRDKLAILPPTDVKLPPIENANFNYDSQNQAYLLAQQIAKATALTPEMRHQYTTRANLGTSLIHGAFAAMQSGDPAARARMEEGLRFIEESITINPLAHFGRETWQTIIVQHFLACLDHPDLITRFDAVGSHLNELKPTFSTRRGLREIQLSVDETDTTISPEGRFNLRTRITPLAPSAEWVNAVSPRFQTAVPFDEPALALMGMWMLGGGPSPHSAIAMADIALQIGQNEIAWDGFERALEMKDRFSADANVRSSLTTYCSNQQAAIAALEAPDSPDAWTTKARQRHADELAWARHYQDDYHAWEAAQIAAGVPLDAPTFYDGFFKTHPSIASPVGHADEIATRIFDPDGFLDALPAGLVMAGICMFLAALTTKRSADPSPKGDR